VFAGVWLGIQYPFALFELAGDASHTAGTFVLFSSTGSWVPGAGAPGGGNAALGPGDSGVRGPGQRPPGVGAAPAA